MRTTKATYELHPEGSFAARIIEHQDSERFGGPSIRWTLETAAKRSDGERFRISYYTSPKWNEKSHLQNLAIAAGTQPPETDEECAAWTEELLLGRVVKILVAHREANDTTYANIVSIGKWKQDPAPAPVPPPPPPMHQDWEGMDDDSDPFATD